MVSIKDLSLACGVSTATVSKALNNHKDVSEETKERIRKMARDMGYVPNFASKVLKTNRTYNIGVVFSDEAGSGLTHDYFAMVLNGLKCTIEEKGYDFTFVNKNGSISTWDNGVTYLEHCKFRRFDGVAVICTDFYSPEIIELIESDIPIVTFDYISSQTMSGESGIWFIMCMKWDTAESPISTAQIPQLPETGSLPSTKPVKSWESTFRRNICGRPPTETPQQPI